MPLPAESTIVRVGADHEIPLHPYRRYFQYWQIVLEPERTIEAVVGRFIIPLSLDDAIIWFQTEMAQRGWTQPTDKSSRLTESAVLRFEQPITKVRAVVGLLAIPDTKQSDAFVRRIVEHPWSPPSNGKGAGARPEVSGRNAKPAARTPKAKKRRVLHKARNRVTA